MFQRAALLPEDVRPLRWTSLMIAASLLTGLLFETSLVAAEKKSQPNIVLIMADDLGYECLEVNGGSSYETPRLNEMAAEGMRFTRCHSQPICTPTRVQIMTGLYNQRNYVRFGLLEPSQMTFAHVLKKNGYRTCIAGKWQLEGGLDGPHHFGFDEYCLWQLTRRPSRYPNPGLEVNGEEIDYPGGYGPDVVNEYVCDFIKKNAEGPFLVYYPMILPHWPFEPTPDSEEWDPKSPGANNSQKNPEFFVDMVNYTDKMVDQVLDQLDELGIRDNTLVLFTGDNGTATSVTSVLDGETYKGGKGSPTRQGMHVPLIATWPGTIEQGAVNGNLVDFTDVFPTLLDVAGVKPPKKLELDGLSFYPQLLGKEGPVRDAIYCWYARNGGKTGVEFAQGQTFKLYREGQYYNIEEDWKEKLPLNVENLSGEAAEAHQKLQAVLDRYEGTRVMLADPAAKADADSSKQKKQNTKKKKNEKASS